MSHFNIRRTASDQIELSSLFFIVLCFQFGYGFFQVPGHLAELTGNQGWLVSFAASVLIQLLLYAGVTAMKKSGHSDWYTMAGRYFGSVGGKLAAALYILFFYCLGIIILRTYVGALQDYLFPRTSTLFLSLLTLLPVYLLLVGGLSLLSRFAILTVLSTLWVLIPLYYPYRLLEPTLLLPMTVQSVGSYGQALMSACSTAFGISLIFFIYPSVLSHKGVLLRVSYAHWLSTFINMLVNLIVAGTMGYEFAELNTYPYLTLYRVSQFAFIESTELIIVAEWSLIISIVIGGFIWVIQQGIRHMVPTMTRTRTMRIPLLFLTLLGVLLLPEESANLVPYVRITELAGIILISSSIALFWLMTKFTSKEGAGT
ncbi:GerAB/ArcD/ProY family transporter [Paenibacillus sp. GCM10023252]|uniref:GerAB/ArcD/ProY family transporter n=1 Tax=Paenibacillus sp. GCM10023252 TaxID=3252649 RepID=UPI00360A20A7